MTTKNGTTDRIAALEARAGRAEDTAVRRPRAIDARRPTSTTARLRLRLPRPRHRALDGRSRGAVPRHGERAAARAAALTARPTTSCSSLGPIRAMGYGPAVLRARPRPEGRRGRDRLAEQRAARGGVRDPAARGCAGSDAVRRRASRGRWPARRRTRPRSCGRGTRATGTGGSRPVTWSRSRRRRILGRAALARQSPVGRAHFMGMVVRAMAGRGDLGHHVAADRRRPRHVLHPRGAPPSAGRDAEDPTRGRVGAGRRHPGGGPARRGRVRPGVVRAPRLRPRRRLRPARRRRRQAVLPRIPRRRDRLVQGPLHKDGVRRPRHPRRCRSCRTRSARPSTRSTRRSTASRRRRPPSRRSLRFASVAAGPGRCHGRTRVSARAVRPQAEPRPRLGHVPRPRRGGRRRRRAAGHRVGTSATGPASSRTTTSPRCATRTGCFSEILKSAGVVNARVVLAHAVALVEAKDGGSLPGREPQDRQRHGAAADAGRAARDAAPDGAN